MPTYLARTVFCYANSDCALANPVITHNHHTNHSALLSKLPSATQISSHTHAFVHTNLHNRARKDHTERTPVTAALVNKCAILAKIGVRARAHCNIALTLIIIRSLARYTRACSNVHQYSSPVGPVYRMYGLLTLTANQQGSRSFMSVHSTSKHSTNELCVRFVYVFGAQITYILPIRKEHGLAIERGLRDRQPVTESAFHS